jgi:hypothetical protein
VTRAANPDALFLPVGVLMERRPGSTPWAEHAWRAIEVLEDAPEVPDWTVLREEAGRTLFFAGRAEVSLHPTDTSNYKHNLEAATPLAWVILRPDGASPAGWRLQGVTIDPGEAHLHADVGSDLLESLPMPPGLRALANDFVARHHRERGFWKRQRDRADPEAMSRRLPGEEAE